MPYGGVTSMDLIFDPTINLEGIATAAAALGAATVYVIDLIGRRLRERSGRRRGARGRMILELVQSRFVEGVDEIEIYRYLQSDDPECIELRKRYKIRKHKDNHKVRQDIETHLIQLVFDRLIEIDSPDHFRLWGSERYVRQLERRAESNGLTGREGLLDVMRPELVENLWTALDNTPNRWEVSNILDELSRLGEPITAERLRELRSRAKDADRLDTDLAIAKFLRET
jgi:hypothetical protein